MQRLSRAPGSGTHPSRSRAQDERGAVAVMVALLMVPLLGFAAISIDVAGMWTEREQLQNGADAGALAVAQDCARGSCGSPGQTVQTLTTANSRGGDSTSSVTTGAQQVSVTSSAVRQHLFAPVLGINSSTIVAHSTAAWGNPTGGTAQLPVAVSWCDFLAQTGGGLPSGSSPRVISFPTPAAAPVASETSQPAADASQPAADASQPAPAATTQAPQTTEPATTSTTATDQAPTAGATPADGTQCTGPAGNSVPAGFRWLPADQGGCRAASSIAGGFNSPSGDGLPSGCRGGDFGSWRGRTVLLPVFDLYRGAATTTAGSYRVYGYAAFTLTGYHFAGSSAGSPCSGSEKCIEGYFTRFADSSDQFDYSSGAPQLGAAVVSLTQ